MKILKIRTLVTFRPEYKKVLLIQAILNDPELLILDESTANLDPTTSEDLINMLLELKNEGKTIFIFSHILYELEKIVDSITFLNNGNVLYTSSIKTYMKNMGLNII